MTDHDHTENLQVEDTTETSSPETSPSTSTKPPAQPTERFIADVCVAIRAGAAPAVAAQWQGVPKKTFQRWMRVHDGLRTEVQKALAHLKVKLQADLAKRSPEKALRRLAQADAGRQFSKAPRDYTSAGQTLVRKAAPFLVERVADESVSDDALSPVEQAARALRQQMVDDHGGSQHVTAAKRALIDSIIGSWLIAQSLSAAVARMASEDGIVSKKHRRAFPVVLDALKAASVLSNQLAQLGLDRPAPTTPTLQAYIESRYGSTAQEDRHNGHDRHTPDATDGQEGSNGALR